MKSHILIFFIPFMLSLHSIEEQYILKTRKILDFIQGGYILYSPFPNSDHVILAHSKGSQFSDSRCPRKHRLILSHFSLGLHHSSDNITETLFLLFTPNSGMSSSGFAFQIWAHAWNTRGFSLSIKLSFVQFKFSHDTTELKNLKILIKN